jgi:RNA polymerase sigma-70 factor (ECF subfamily)
VQSVRAFALGVARHLALNWMRRQRIVPMDSIGDLEDLGSLDEGEQVERIVSTEQEITLLMEAVQGLPEKCRQVFTLRKVYGFSQKEIAVRMGISENTVEQHLTKAGRRCAQFLFEHSSPREARSSVLSMFKGRRRSHDDRE